LEPALGLIESDSGQLSQVIINLTVNARDAMPKGGIVTIETSNAAIGNNFEAEPTLPPPGSYVLFTIRDNGVGMDKEILENVFEPFFTTKGIGEGTGLGLATVYGIVNQSNGHIFVESVVNEGTVFRIYLPRVDEIAPHDSTEESPGMIKKGTETILIVEDEAMVRALTRQVLEECGYTIFEAGNGVEALAKFEKRNGEIDMVLTDVIMPLMGGRELGNRLSKIRPELPILFTSGYADDEGFGEYVSEKHANFIAKPFTFEQLARKVRDFLDQKKARLKN
jgi:CheY-like chemotaxis protein